MSFVDRKYPDIVRDVLTNLTQGVSRELHSVSYNPLARPVLVPDIVLQRRPVKRVSTVEGYVEPAPGAELVRYSFSLSDYELVGDPDTPEDLYRVHFLPFGRKPADGTTVSVNYYPRTSDPTPLTDLNVGSVARTMLEAVSREMALLYEQLNLAYDSAFLETATGASLDRVVALLGYKRFRAGRPVGAVTFTRRKGSNGSITIPAGTPVTDAQDTLRYVTVETRAILEGETTAQIAVRGATDSTAPVDTGVLTVIQRSIAGIEAAINERPTTRASDDETDEQLRARARDALIASNKGTVSAITHGLLQLPEVRDAKVEEMPNGVPGEISIAVSLAQPSPDGSLPRSVRARIEELRPAGIRIVSSAAGSVALQANVQLTLAGSTFPDDTIADIHNSVQKALVSEIAKRGVGEKIRIKPLAAAILRDERIVDASIVLSAQGGPAGEVDEDFQPPTGSAVQIASGSIAFGADLFDQPLGQGENVPVEVHAVISAAALPGVSSDEVKARISARLSTFFEGLTAGASVDSNALLTALRDDTRYSIDPLKMQVTLTSADQFVQILQSGPAFQVSPQQVFTLASVELLP